MVKQFMKKKKDFRSFIELQLTKGNTDWESRSDLIRSSGQKISGHINRILKVLDHALESTKNMEAKVGRAKFLDTKGVGITDPGAFSTTLILKEFFKEFVNEKNN